jgi:hypothetical protein
MNEGALRAVKIAAVVMAVLIVLGTTTLFVILAKRGMSAETATAASPAQIAAILDEPPGTRIAGIAAVADRLAVHLTGEGADRVVFVDPGSGQIVGRVTLAR